MFTTPKISRTIGWFSATLLFAIAASPVNAQAANSVSPQFTADQGQVGHLRIGMSLASLERAIRKKVQLHPAGTNQSGAMLEKNDLVQLGISKLYGARVEGADVFFVENHRKQLHVQLFAVGLPCSARAQLLEQFEQQTASTSQTPAGLPYRVSKNGKYAFDFQEKPVCAFWVRHV